MRELCSSYPLDLELKRLHRLVEEMATRAEARHLDELLRRESERDDELAHA